MSEQERWVGVQGVAMHLGVNKDSVYRWIETRALPAHRVGRLYRFRISEVDEWVESLRLSPGGPSRLKKNEEIFHECPTDQISMQ